MSKVDANVNAINFQRWNRKILNAYWLILLISFGGKVIGAFFVYGLKARPLNEYIAYALLLPTIVVCVTIFVAEWVNKRFPSWSNYWIIATGTAIASEFIILQTFVKGLHMALVLPILASLFYFQWRKVMFSYLLNVAALLLIFTFSRQYSIAADWRELISTLTVMTCGVVLANGIMSRGADIQRNLVQMVEAQQDLLVRHAMMDKISKTDALTELYNHKTFHEYLDKLIEQSDRSGLSLQLAIIDIDNFKKVNDTYGHWVGDLVLRSVARTVKSTLTVDDFAARFGGEEFAVIFADKTDEQALQAVERIRRTVAQHVYEELEGQPVTISVGLQAYARDSGKERLFKGADAALYTAKRAGKNRTIFQSQDDSVQDASAHSAG